MAFTDTYMVLYARVGADSGPFRGVPNVADIHAHVGDSQWHSDRDFGEQVTLSYDHLYIFYNIPAQN